MYVQIITIYVRNVIPNVHITHKYMFRLTNETQLFVDLNENRALTMTRRPISDDVMIAIYTNKTLAPKMS